MPPSASISPAVPAPPASRPSRLPTRHPLLIPANAPPVHAHRRSHCRRANALPVPGAQGAPPVPPAGAGAAVQSDCEDGDTCATLQQGDGACRAERAAATGAPKRALDECALPGRPRRERARCAGRRGDAVAAWSVAPRHTADRHAGSAGRAPGLGLRLKTAPGVRPAARSPACGARAPTVAARAATG